jgi:hypothetical protein
MVTVTHSVTNYSLQSLVFVVVSVMQVIRERMGHLQLLLQDPVWRKTILKLAEKHPQCVLLNDYMLLEISKKGFHR